MNKVLEAGKDKLNTDIECKHVTEVLARITDAVPAAGATINLSIQEVTILKQNSKMDDRVKRETVDKTGDELTAKTSQVTEEYNKPHP